MDFTALNMFYPYIYKYIFTFEKVHQIEMRYYKGAYLNELADSFLPCLAFCIPSLLTDLLFPSLPHAIHIYSLLLLLFTEKSVAIVFCFPSG